MKDTTDLIPHIQRIAQIQCGTCPRKSALVLSDSTAIMARTFHLAGWRVANGKPMCSTCVARLAETATRLQTAFAHTATE